MKDKKIKLLFSLSLILSLLCGCASGYAGQTGENSTAAEESEEQPVGRYIESTIDLSGMMTDALSLVRMNDGRLVITARSGLYESRDNGVTWEQLRQDWLQDLDENVISVFEASKDGYCALVMDNGERAETWAGRFFSDMHIIVSPDGKPMSIDSPFKAQNETLIGVRKFCFSDSGKLYACSYGGKIYEIDREDGSYTPVVNANSMIHYISFQGNTLVIRLYDGLYLYDLEKGDWIEDPVLKEFLENEFGKLDWDVRMVDTVTFPGEEEDVVYVACEKGLYRHVIGGSIMEQVFDGIRTNLGNPAMMLKSMMALENNEFLALYLDGTLSRFTYSPESPIAAEKQLKVYSLTENDLLKKAIYNYQAEHPEVYVTYEIGQETNTAVTREDALKKLNMKIMAGEGPDFMVLDDMPINSYMEKGVLLDISPYLSVIEKEEGLVGNVADLYRTDNAVYAIPALYKIPLMVGKKEDLEKIHDLKSFADTVEAIRKEDPEEQILGVYKEIDVIKLLAMVCAPSWEKDRKPSEENLIEFLVQAKRVYQAETEGITEDIWKTYVAYGYMQERDTIFYNKGNFYENVSNQALDYVVGTRKLISGYVMDTFDLAKIASLIREKEDADIDFASFTGQSHNVFLPNTILGINAKSEQADLAGDFLQSMLSRKIMNLGEGGYPVNRLSLEDKLSDRQAAKLRKNIWGEPLFRRNAKIYWFDLSWPTNTQVEKFKDLIMQAETPHIYNSQLENAVYEIGPDVLNGSISVEEGVAEIIKKAAIQMAE